MEILKISKAILMAILIFVAGLGWIIGACYFVAKSPKILGYCMLGIFGALCLGAVALEIYKTLE